MFTVIADFDCRIFVLLLISTLNAFICSEKETRVDLKACPYELLAYLKALSQFIPFL